MQTDARTIGTPGRPWGEAEIAQWRSGLSRRRSYADEVLTAVERLGQRFATLDYGRLEYEADVYPLVALASRDWNDDLPSALITGGVHGYETSGVQGALRFAEQDAERFAGRINLLVAPCVSPWGYERIHRWNPNAVDPNRSFRPASRAPEAAALMSLIASRAARFALHIDLHETTDSDETEFRPAQAARDGKPYVAGVIPDGFYLVGDSERPELAFQNAVLEAVGKVTHIAQSDAAGRLIGTRVSAPGVIEYPVTQLGLCVGVTRARFVTTTEVYPDSPRTTPEICNAAQATAVSAALEYVLAPS